MVHKTKKYNPEVPRNLPNKNQTMVNVLELCIYILIFFIIVRDCNINICHFSWLWQMSGEAFFHELAVTKMRMTQNFLIIPLIFLSFGFGRLTEAKLWPELVSIIPMEICFDVLKFDLLLTHLSTHFLVG